MSYGRRGGGGREEFDNRMRISLWEGKNAGKGQNPDLTGIFTDANGKKWWVSLWEGDGKGNTPVLSGSVQDPDDFDSGGGGRDRGGGYGRGGGGSYGRGRDDPGPRDRSPRGRDDGGRRDDPPPPRGESDYGQRDGRDQDQGRQNPPRRFLDDEIPF